MIENANRYPLSAPIGYEKYPSIPIAGNNRSPIGIGSYRLPIDLEPIVQGVVCNVYRALRIGTTLEMPPGFVLVLCAPPTEVIYCL